MRKFVRFLLGFVFIATLALAGVLLRGPKQIETWATLTAVLAVIAAVISAWPALRVLEIQEDAMRPSPTPYFDLTSRYGFTLLRVKNFGSGVAYDVKLIWKERPKNEEGKEVVIQGIPVLTPQESVSLLVGRSMQLFHAYPSMTYEGTVEFKDVSKKSIKQRFICSADAYRHRLLHDDELPRTLYDLQKIPERLTEIREAIEKTK